MSLIGVEYIFAWNVYNCRLEMDFPATEIAASIKFK